MGMTRIAHVRKLVMGASGCNGLEFFLYVSHDHFFQNVIKKNYSLSVHPFPIQEYTLFVLCTISSKSKVIL